MSQYARILASNFEKEVVHETVPTTAYQPPPKPELRDWPAAELLQIALVLRKLTALRIKNPDDAEDLVQDTLLTMAMKCSQIELRKGLLEWGMGILRKKVGNYYRRIQRYHSREAAFLHLDRLTAQGPPSPESSFLQAELSSLLDTMVARLSPRERTVMSLALTGLSTHEIVELLHPERYQNVVNRLHRGRKKLYRELAKHGYNLPHPRKRKKSS